jgi:hypothetical protein
MVWRCTPAQCRLSATKWSPTNRTAAAADRIFWSTTNVVVAAVVTVVTSHVTSHVTPMSFSRSLAPARECGLLRWRCVHHKTGPAAKVPRACAVARDGTDDANRLVVADRTSPGTGQKGPTSL